MSESTKQGDELMSLAAVAEAHLRENGHDVKVEPNTAVTSFEIRPQEGENMFCRVQAVGAETWEVVCLSGDTLTGMGGEQIFLTMLERVVTDAVRKAA